jgi:hypothetical protein
MGSERASTVRMREQGRICWSCKIPLAPPHPYKERLCHRCEKPHRVYIHTTRYKELWVVQYLEEDLKTPLGRMYHYPSLDTVRTILSRAGVDPQTREEFESGVRRWAIGACFLNLTGEQYQKLKR